MSLKQPHYYPGTPAACCLSYDEPLDLARLAEILSREQPYLVWLDSARPHPVAGRFSILGWDPWLIASSLQGRIEQTAGSFTTRRQGNPLEAVRGSLAGCVGPRGAGLPPIGIGVFCVLSYDLNRWIERLPPPKPTDILAPELLLLGTRMLVVVDHIEQRSWCVSIIDPYSPPQRACLDADARLEELKAVLASGMPAHTIDPHSASTSLAAPRCSLFSEDRGKLGLSAAIEPTMSQAQFEAMVRSAQDYIKAGDIFQANLSQCFIASWGGSPLRLYMALRQINPSPFACFLQVPGFSIISCSPERLVRVHNGFASARPIAGTRPRGISPEEDLVMGLELLLSDKERAEHIMLVDLARNDLGRACRYGSVKVDELMVLEDYSHVIHIVSNVQGILRDNVGPVDVIQAMFPGGTITGCPKVRSMQIIHELEPVARGLYTGSCGYIGFDGSLDFNILIRTMFAQGGRIWFHVGAGIVADSLPDREYHETLAKAGALFKALQAAQTIAPKPNAFVG